MSVDPERLLDAVIAQYLGSGDFNGLPSYVAEPTLQCSRAHLIRAVRDLVERGAVSVLFGDRHPNPHIRALEDESTESQLAKLEAVGESPFVMYPTAAVLSSAVDRSLYLGRPYTLALALGKPQLDYACFDPVALEFYHRDPRYVFWSDDIQGSISVGDAAYESDKFPSKHKVLLQSFAFAFDDDLERAVAVFYTDLSRLSPEHQQMWSMHELDGSYAMHPDAYRALVIGDWGLKVSLGDAFLEELKTINRMCELIGWEPLFKRSYETRPQGFRYMLRPTRRELNDFVLLLDKMLSDNINPDFFPDNIARTTEKERTDGKVEVQQRGTIVMLEDWLNTAVRLPDPGPKDEMLRELREIRKLRQKPAHAVDDDSYDPALFQEQRRLFLNGYDVVRTLRLLLANHPRARRAQDEMNEQVRKGEIWPL